MGKNSVKKGIFKAVLCIFLVAVPVSLLLYWTGILPCTRQHFLCYDSFLSKAWDGSVERYPEKLPPSTKKLTYIYYTGWLDKKSGISFTVSDSDYSELKESLRASYFDKMSVGNEYRRYNDAVYVFDGKVTSDLLEKEELGYLKQIFRDPAENYTIPAFRGDNIGGQRCIVEGVFCNDETNEIVIFGFMDVFRKGSE